MPRSDHLDASAPGPRPAPGPGAGNTANRGRPSVGSAPRGWTIEATTGTAQWFHDLKPTAETNHQVWIHDIPTEAIVLGSAQNGHLIRADEAERQAVEVCRRRSGGGLVHIQPESDLWIDIVIPRHSPLWNDDIGQSFHWLGRHWVRMLERYYEARGVDLDWTVATRPVRRPEGRLLCFADVGHGEVLCRHRKVVGLSQRRTRDWARLQGLVVARARHRSLLPVLDAHSAVNALAKAVANHRPPGGQDDPPGRQGTAIRVDRGDPAGDNRRLAAMLGSVDDTVGLPAGCPLPDRTRLIDDFCRSLPAV